jgi:acyl dehydratase
MSAATFGPVTRTDLVRYAGASGDFTPLHHDEEFAREAGFPMPFAMGMYSAGLVGTWLTDRVHPSRVRRFRIRFVRQVWPGDVLTVDGPLPDDLAEGFDVEIDCRTVDGAVVTKVWATVSSAACPG